MNSKSSLQFQDTSEWINWLVKEQKIKQIQQLKTQKLFKRIIRAIKQKHRTHEQEAKLSKYYQENLIGSCQNSNGKVILPKERWVAKKIQDKYGPLYSVNQNKIGKYQIKTVDQQTCLLRFCVDKIVEVIQHLKYSESVLSTALIIFRRFYLRSTMYDYDPIEIMFVAIFLAIKLEDYSINIKQFCAKVPQCSPDIIEKYEFTLLKGIKFDISFYCPFRTYKRLVQIYCQCEKISQDKIFIKGYNFLIQLYKTNYIFLYSSSYMSLASLMFSLKDASVPKSNVEIFLRSNIFALNSEADNQKLVQECFNLLKQSAHLIEGLRLQNDKKKIQKIRLSLKMFHKSIPQFMEKVEERDAENKLLQNKPTQQLNKNSGFDIEVVEDQVESHLKSNSQISNANDKDGFAVPMPTVGKRKKMQ